MQYNEKIRYAIKKAGTTASKAAEYIGVSQPMMSKVINGRAEFSSENLVKLADFLKVPVDFFLKSNYVPIEEAKLNDKIRKILEDSETVNYMVLLDNAKQSGLTPHELEKAINFAAEMKKQGAVKS